MMCDLFDYEASEGGIKGVLKSTNTRLKNMSPRWTVEFPAASQFVSFARARE